MKQVTRVRTGLAMTVVAGTLLTAACGSSANDNTAAATPQSKYKFGLVGDQTNAGTPVRGGTLTIADYSEPRSLDPSVTYADASAGGDAMAAIYDELMRYDPQSGKYEPNLAKDLVASADFKTWTLTLRPDVKFADGEPLDAKAVIGSINYYMGHKGADTALLAPNIASMKPSGNLGVVFTMRNSWAKFPSMLSQAAGMVLAPKAYAGKTFQPIGAGPFTLQSYSPSESLILKANPNYFAGAPLLAGLKFIWPGTDDAKLDLMKSGAADVAYLRDPQTVDTALKTSLPGYLSLSNIGNVILINNRKGTPGADVRVRQAVALAIDPKTDFQRAFNGAGLPGTTIFPVESRWHTSVSGPSVDLAKAKSLLAAAKKDGYDGVIRYMGRTDPTSRAEAVATQAMLERVGFTVKLDLVASVADQIQKMYVTHDFDLARGAVSVQESDPFQRLQTNMNSKSFGNATGVADPKIDALLKQLQAADSDAQVQTALDGIQQQVNETVPFVNEGSGAVFLPWQKTVHGLVPTVNQMLLFGKAWKS